MENNAVDFLDSLRGHAQRLPAQNHFEHPIGLLEDVVHFLLQILLIRRHGEFALQHPEHFFLRQGIALNSGGAPGSFG